MTVIARAEAEGRMEAEEIPGICLMLLIAGWETTAGLLSNAFLHLAGHPEQRSILLAEPDLIPAAVELAGETRCLHAHVVRGLERLPIRV